MTRSIRALGLSSLALGLVLCNEHHEHHANGTPGQPQVDGVSGAVAKEDHKPAIHEKVLAQFDSKVETKEFKFNFKTDKESGVKRPTVELVLPVPSIEGIVHILENATEFPKQYELLRDAIYEVIADQARGIVNDNEAVTQENFPLNQVTWEAIANMPKAERRGGGISKEVWEEFGKDYIEVMPAATGKPVEKVALASKILVGKLNQVKTNKAVLAAMKEFLGIYINVTPNAETFLPCVEFLKDKAEKLINAEDVDLIDAL